jgi:hypothetical protein
MVQFSVEVEEAEAVEAQLMTNGSQTKTRPEVAAEEAAKVMVLEGLVMGLVVVLVVLNLQQMDQQVV